MAEQRFFDFDAAMAEVKEEPVMIKIFGKKEALPASLPAQIVLTIIRAEKNDNMSDSQMLEMAVSVFGEKRLQKWCDKGLTMTGIEQLMKNVLPLYAPQGTVKSGKGEASNDTP